MVESPLARVREARRRSALRWRALPVVVGTSVLLALSTATPASAHDALETAAPAADSTVTETLSGVSLGFTEDLLVIGDDASGFAIQVTDEDDRHYESGCVTLDGPTAGTQIAPGPAGTYEVVWQVVSSDGHPTSGSYTFTYSPAEAGPQSNHTIAPLCGDAWAGTPRDDAAPLPTLSADPAAPIETAAPEVPLETPAAEDTPAPGEDPAASEPPAAGETPAPSDTAAADETPAPGDGDGEDAEAASSAVPLWAIVLGGLAALGLIAAVIVLTLRRSRRLPGENDPTV